MSECKTCGRDDGHWIGCAEAASRRREAVVTSEDSERERTRESECVKDGCTNPRREAKGKGPAPKYCEDHSDPKNRK